jgi:hypothetical protein
MLPITRYKYIFPPRPKTALPSTALASYDRGEYIAQPKLNGDCVLIFMNGKETIVMDRHKSVYAKCRVDVSKLYRETLVDGRKTNKWMVLVGEYMVKSKRGEDGKTWNHKFVIHDIIAYDGAQLIGKTTLERVELLDALYGKDDKELTPDGVTTYRFMHTTPEKDCYRVKSYMDCFEQLYEDLVTVDMYEGVVLKKAKAKLENGTSERNNSGSMCKVRKETKNYTY